MARKLQNALAIASYKARHEIDNFAFDLAEDRNASRKRRRSSITTSPISSSSSEPQRYPRPFDSSPIKASGSTYALYSARVEEGPHKRSMNQPRLTYSSPHKKPFRESTVTLPTLETSRNSWKSMHKLPESSPASQCQRVHFPTSHEASASFISEASTVPDSPPLGHVSDEEICFSQSSFNRDSYNFNVSGPRTPPPTRTRSNRHRKSNPPGEGAFLLDPSNSPSPANLSNLTASRMYPPSTPPSNAAGLGNSMISTPRGGGYAAPVTPGPALNFSEFLNMTPTPSPAQGAFGSYTPGLPNTPLAAKEARKKLQDGGQAPTDGSPIIGGSGRKSMKKGTGLGMDLGGELLPQ